MKTPAPNINYFWAELIVEELIRNGVNNFFISPGSRSSALTMAVAENPKAISHIHFDERGSAFRALGHISGNGKPVAIITTSGTAAANLFPAIIEASKKKIPMIILTADRPPELRATGAHQTIDQNKIYGAYVRWFMDMPCPTEKIPAEFVLTTIDQAISQACGNPGGPVHLNCMYREPLAPSKTKFQSKQYGESVKSWYKGKQPYTQYVRPSAQIKASDISAIANHIKAVKKGIIAVGKLKNEAEQKSVLAIAEKLQWPVLADITSGLRLGNSHNHVIHYFDQLLLCDKAVNNLKADGILHLGGRITSKRWYQFIEDLAPKQYIMVLNHPLRNDPLHNVTLRIQCTVEYFCKALIKIIPQRKPSTTLKSLQSMNNKAHNAIDAFFKNQTQLNEPQTARIITDLIPKGHALFNASSMPIRDCDTYGTHKGNAVAYGSNRGASGIDGTIATAVGFSESLGRPTTLIIGDLAFLYDLNALSMVKDLKHPMVIVVINNDGGGIFSFLPIHDRNPQFERYFGAPHHLQFHGAGDLFDLNYARIDSAEALAKTYKVALQSQTSTIIEIPTNREENLTIHQQLQSSIQQTIDGAKQKTARKHHEQKHSRIRRAGGVDNIRQLRRYQIR